MKIESTKNTPFINLTIENCIFEIKGDSYSDVLQDLYDQILIWIDEEIPKLNCELNCVFNFNILNSISMKNVIVILSKLNQYYKTGKKITITWYYDTDDDIDIAEDFSEFLEMPFKIIEAR